MSVSETNDIQTNAQIWYEKHLEQATSKKTQGQKPSIVELIVWHADQWYIRALFPLLHLWLVRLAQDIMNPGDEDPEDPEPLK